MRSKNNYKTITTIGFRFANHLILMYASDMQLFFLVGPVFLIGMWFGEDQRANITKTHVLKEIELCFQILITFIYSNNEHN